MRVYASLIRLRAMLLLQYRAAAFAGMVTQFSFGIVRVMLFEGFYASSTAPQPMPFPYVVSYIWLCQALIGLLPWGGDGEIQELVLSGNVAYELCRPVSLFGLWYSRCIALRTVPTAMRAVPLITVAVWLLPPLYRLALPGSPAAALAFVVSIGGAVLLSAAISNLYNVFLMWTVSGEGLVRLLPPFVTLFSGALIPVSFFPDWLQPLLRFLPFSGVIDLPLRFYIGDLPAAAWLGHLAYQLAWVAVLVVTGRWLVSRGMRRIVVQGG